MSNPWEPITAVATSVLALATIIGGLFAYQQIKVIHDQIDDGVAARRATEFVELRKTFLAVDKDLDGFDRDKPYPDNASCQAWNAFKRYWYFTETEWEIAQIDPSQISNWIKGQRPRFMHSLGEISFRSVFLAMAKRSFNAPSGNQFVSELENTYLEEHHKRLTEEANTIFPRCEAGKTDVSSCACVTGAAVARQ